MTEEKICKNNDPFVFVHRDCAVHGRVKRWACEDCVFDQAKKHEEEMEKMDGWNADYKNNYNKLQDKIEKLEAEKKAIFDAIKSFQVSKSGKLGIWLSPKEWQALKKKFGVA